MDTYIHIIPQGISKTNIKCKQTGEELFVFRAIEIDWDNGEICLQFVVKPLNSLYRRFTCYKKSDLREFLENY